MHLAHTEVELTLARSYNNNPAVESHPVDYVNDPGVIAQNESVISINAALQINVAISSTRVFLQTFYGVLDFPQANAGNL